MGNLKPYSAFIYYELPKQVKWLTNKLLKKRY